MSKVDFNTGDRVKLRIARQIDIAKGMVTDGIYVIKCLTVDGRIVIREHDIVDPSQLELAGKQKPTKPATESDRRKAAKAVRVLEKKLKEAIKKAGETGISVKDYEHIISTWVIDMSYQPETPKKRVYK